MAGQLGGAQQLLDRLAGRVGSELAAVLLGHLAGGGQVVEPASGAAGEGVGDDGQHRIQVRGKRAVLCRSGLGLGERGPVAVDLGRADHVGHDLPCGAGSDALGFADLRGVGDVAGDDEQQVRLLTAGGGHIA
ncbi:MAG: hypothetical protein L0K86_14555, partial [Actinomycetia bacterium]|nr:hypothetical protein [Actinomycetes bacterium]